MLMLLLNIDYGFHWSQTKTEIFMFKSKHLRKSSLQKSNQLIYENEVNLTSLFYFSF